ncbi:MAG: DUF2723 domain-containing protein [Bacteroidales bacterium]|nr:DUF2723 domain-containing protein [Bacteroidales bacterium]
MNFSDKTVSWAICLIALLLYLLNLEPVGGFWDSSEWVASAINLEVGHPPGAPFYILLARFLSIFSFGNTGVAAFLVNSLSAVSSALCIYFLYHSIKILGRKLSENINFSSEKVKNTIISGSSAIGSLTFAVSDSFWHSATEAEVYALSNLFIAIAFWAILKWESEFDKAHSQRYLYLIFLLMGLSVGTHLLNLLAIPAIVFVYGFKRYQINFKNIVKISAFGIGLLAFMQYLFIPGLTRILAYSDVLFVNIFNFPLRSGIYISFLLLAGLAFAGIFISIRKNKQKLQFVLSAFLLLLIGYSSYGLILIRSAADTPINEANPSHAYSFISYVEREQYGTQPLFKGHYFNSEPDRRFPYKKVGTHKKPINNRYETTGIKTEPNYKKADVKWFPRMWSARPEHIAAYKEWSKTDGENLPSVSENFRFFTRYQLGHMYWRYFMWNFVGRQNDIQGHGGPLYGNWISGIKFIDNLRLGTPKNIPDIFYKNKARNTYFFLPLILGLIGLVYQFKKDKKNFTVLSILFVFTGLAIAIWLNQHPEQQRERDYSYVASFYTFSIWIGLGCFAIFQFLKEKHKNFKNALIVISISAIVPILMGFQNFDDHNKSNRKTAYEIAYNYLIGLAPDAILFTNGDNDTFPLWYLQEVEGIRRDVRVVNLSYLNYDWYIDQCRKKQHQSKGIPLQLDESLYSAGNRDFVYVYDYVFSFVDKIYEENKAEYDLAMHKIYESWVNLLENSLYAKENSENFEKAKKDFMFMAPHGKNPQFKAFRVFTEGVLHEDSILKYEINKWRAQDLLSDIEKMLSSQLSKSLELKDLMNFVFSDKEENKAKMQYSETPVNYFPTNKLKMQIDKNAIIRSGTIKENQMQWLVEKLEWEIKSNILTKSNLIVLEIINENNWQRPIYFTTTAGLSNYLGLEKYFALEGLCFRLLPIRNELSEDAIGYIDSELLYDNLKNKFKYQSYTKAKYLDDNMREFASNYRNIFAHCSRALYFDGKVKKATEIIDLCLELFPNSQVPHSYYTTPLVHAYYRLNKKKEARELASQLAQNSIDVFEFLASFDKKYQHSLQAEREKCIATMQYLYSMAKEYNHKEYLPEIEMQYGKILSLNDQISNKKLGK